MKHGVWAINYPAVRGTAEMVELAVAAEEAGWDGVFVSDSISDGTTDALVTLAAIAERTERVTLGRGSPRRPPTCRGDWRTRWPRWISCPVVG